MADSIYTFDPVAGNNTSLDTIPYGPNQLYHNQIDNLFRAINAKTAQWVDDLGAVNTVGGTGDAVTVTLASGITAYATGQIFRFIASAANTGAATMNVNSIGAKAIRKISGGTDVALSAGDIAAGETYLVRYSATANSSAGAWILVGVTASADTTWQSTTTPINMSLAASVGSNALTIAIKGNDGNDPSSSNKVYIPFRSATPGSGDMDVLAISAATSLVISSGSTLGAPTGSVPFKVWVVGFNDAGTFRLGAILCTTLASGVLTQYPLSGWGIASATAEGGAGGADTAQTFYTGTAVTSKAYTVLGVLSFESGLATAGTWASAPTRVQVFDASVALPGAVVQVRRTQTGAVATGTTSTPIDDSIPQQSEMDIYMSQAITPTSSANLLRLEASSNGSTDSAGATRIPYGLFQDAVGNALATAVASSPGTGSNIVQAIEHVMIAATTSSTTIKFGSSDGGGTWTFNGSGGSRVLGGSLSSYLEATEIAA